MAGNHEELRAIPALPGAYIFRDRDGKVLYVGKARDLRKRVRSHFRGSPIGRLALLVARIDAIETLVAASETEALLLEATLIKRHRPRFNVAMKDDKSYPSFRLTVQEPFPRLELTRRIERDGSLYFGPFADAGAAREAARVLQRAFPLRRCRGARPGGRGRPGRACLDFQMGRCLGPCVGKANADDYRGAVEELSALLRGRGSRVVRALRNRMEKASRELHFEEAASLRDRLAALSQVVERQTVVGDPGEDADVLGVHLDGEEAQVTCLLVRSGMVVGKRDSVFNGVAEPGEAVEACLAAHYRERDAIPPRLLLPPGVSFRRCWEELLSGRAGRKVEILQPMRGKGARLVAMAMVNAREALRQGLARRESAETITAEAARVLQLPVPPRRIAGLDVSHAAGRAAYAAMVVWREGSFTPGEYRLFRLRVAVSGDDISGLTEAVRRRFTGTSATDVPDPDLLLVDGGKGQLGRVGGLLSEMGKDRVQAVSISKGRTEKRRSPGGGSAEEIWLPGRANPLRLPAHHPVLRLLQSVRDEAHRFALKGHRRRRGQDDLTVVLDGIPGVGPARRRALMTHFRSLADIAAASQEQVASVPGLNQRLARDILEHMEKQGIGLDGGGNKAE
jgi:excinuclease ABC subunit C